MLDFCRGQVDTACCVNGGINAGFGNKGIKDSKEHQLHVRELDAQQPSARSNRRGGDKHMPSLRRRQYKSGNFVWVVDYRINGKGRSYVLGDVDKLMAQRLYHEFCAKLLQSKGEAESHVPLATTRQHLAEVRVEEENLRRVSIVKHIPELEREYMAYSRANKAENTCEIIQIAFWKFREFADDILLTEVDFQLIERFKAWRLKSVNGTTLNISLRALRAGFEFAVKLGWLDKNPFKGVKQVHVPEPDYAVYLDEDEVKQLLAVVPDPEFQRLLRFYLLTGCRRTEAVMIDWHDVDLDKRTIVIRGINTKTRRNRVLQMSDKLHALLMKQEPKKQGRVFPRWQAGSVTVMFRRYVSACNFGRKISVHSLRHTTVVGLLTAGVDLYTIARILGHSSTKVTELTYAHVSPAHKMDAMNKLPY